MHYFNKNLYILKLLLNYYYFIKYFAPLSFVLYGILLIDSTSYLKHLLSKPNSYLLIYLTATISFVSVSNAV